MLDTIRNSLTKPANDETFSQNPCPKPPDSGPTMPTFDKSQCPPETPQDIFDATNELIGRLRAKLVKEIPFPEPPTGIRIFNKVRGYHQAHLRRILTFLDGGLAEYAAGRPLMTELATRAIYENVANLCDFTETLKQLCNELDFDGIDDHV